MRIDDLLLEREPLLARAQAALGDAVDGRGSVLYVAGPAGIGKTALLQAITDRADGFTVLQARGGELERGFPHGVVRQLFEAHVHGLDAHERDALLTGAAGLARPVVAPDAADVGNPAETSFAIAHGLYWFTANLADRGPLLLAVDDVHWADVASLRFLAHLCRRIEGLQVLVVACERSAEPGTPHDLLAEIATEAQVLTPEPLSPAAVQRLIPGSDEPFAAACHTATGGVPFLLHALVAALGDRPPVERSIPHMERTGPTAVARATLARLRALPPEATELARAVAVLGADGRLHRAGRLAGISEDESVAAADALTAMHVLRERRPLDFVHPIVRSAVYDAIPPAARAAAHLRAARMLEQEGADDDAVAGHLVLAEPGAHDDAANRLRATADRALARGAPESAAAYLRRALQEELDSETRAEVLLELARAQRLIDVPSAAEPLRNALELAQQPSLRARITYEIADASFFVGGWDEVGALLDAALETALDQDLTVRIEAIRAALDFYLAARAREAFQRLPRLAEATGIATPAARVMALMLAGNAGWLGQPAQVVWGLIERGLDGGRFLAEEGSNSWATPFLVQAAVLTDDLDRADAVIDQVLADARRRGSVRGVTVCVYHRGWASARRGDLVAAEADLRTAVELMPMSNGLGGVGELPLWAMILDAVLERPTLDDRAALLAHQEIPPHLDDIVWGVSAHESRGRTRLAAADREGAIADLRACNHPVFGRGAQPNTWIWRSVLAVALAPTELDEARELAARDLRTAQRVQRPRGLAIAHRTQGLVEGSLEHLEEAVRQAESSPSRLEHARSLVELGAALRRANRRSDAREPLRLGLDLAHRCGAVRLAERAHTELIASGARPRREVLTGADALTPTERRIAAMAAEGMSNPEIAQTLFVTRKTVENHLARAYGKLGIGSRTEIRRALETGGR